MTRFRCFPARRLLAMLGCAAAAFPGTMSQGQPALEDAQLVLASPPRQAAAWERAREQLTRELRLAESGVDQGVSYPWNAARVALGDLWWHPSSPGRNWGIAWSHYGSVLDTLGSQPASEGGRLAYLSLLLRFVEVTPATVTGQPPTAAPPLATLVGALPLAREQADRGQLLLAIALRRRDIAASPAGKIAATAAFEAAIQASADTPWEGPARLAFARWCLVAGRTEAQVDGSLGFLADPARAERLLEPWSREAIPADPPGWPPGALARSVERLLSDLRAPVLDLQVPFQAPSEPARLALLARNLERVVVRFVAVEPTVDQIGPPPGPWWIAGEPAAPPDPALATEVVIDLPREPLHELWQRDLPLPPGLRPGLWLASATADSVTSPPAVLVSNGDLLLDLLPAGNQLVAWVRDAGTGGGPVADAVVEIGDAQGRRRELRTDRDGLARQPLGDLGPGPVRAVARQGRRATVARLDGIETREVAADWLALSPMSRVQPLGEVSWILFAARHPAPAVVRWMLKTDEGRMVATGFHEPVDPGSLAGRAPLPRDLPPGLLHLHVDGNAVPSRSWSIDVSGRLAGRLQLDVATSPSPEGLAGLALEVNGRWNPPEGNARGQALLVEVTLDDKPGMVRSPESHPLRERARVTSDDARIVWSGTVQAGADGRFSKSIGIPPLSAPTPLLVRAVTLDTRGPTVVAERAFVAAPTTYVASLVTASPTIVAGGELAYAVRTHTPTGQPIAVTGRLVAELRTWSERWTRRDGTTVEGPPPEAERRPWWSFSGAARAELDWRPAEPSSRSTMLATVELSTDRDGLASGTIAVTEPGLLTLRWSSGDVGGRPVVDEASAWIGPASSADLPLHATPRLLPLPLRQLTEEGTGRWMLIADRPRTTWLAGWHVPGLAPQLTVVRTELGSVAFELQPAPIDASLVLLSHEGVRHAGNRTAPRRLLVIASGTQPWVEGNPGEVTARLLPPDTVGTLHWITRQSRATATATKPVISSARWDASAPLPIPVVPTADAFEIEAVFVGNDGTLAHSDRRFAVQPGPSIEVEAPASARRGDTVLVSTRLGPTPEGEPPPMLEVQPGGMASPRVASAGTPRREGASWTWDHLVQSSPGLLPEEARLRVVAVDTGKSTEVTIDLLPSGGFESEAPSPPIPSGSSRSFYAPPTAIEASLLVSAPGTAVEAMRGAADVMASSRESDAVTLAAQAVGAHRLAGIPVSPSVVPGRPAEVAARALLERQDEDGGWPTLAGNTTDWRTTALVAALLAQSKDPLLERAARTAISGIEAKLADESSPADFQVWLMTLLALVPPTEETRPLAVSLANHYLRVMQRREELSPALGNCLAFVASTLGFAEDIALLLDEAAASPDGDPDPFPAPSLDPSISSLFAAKAAVGTRSHAARVGMLLQVHRSSMSGKAWPTPERNALALLGLSRAHDLADDTEPSPGRGRLLVNGTGLDLDTLTSADWRELPWPEPGRPIVVKAEGEPGTFAPVRIVPRFRLATPEAEAHPSGMAVERTILRESTVQSLLGKSVTIREVLREGMIVRVGDELVISTRMSVPAGVTTALLEDEPPPGLVLRGSGFMTVELRQGAESGDDAERRTGKLAMTTHVASEGGHRWIIEDLDPGSWELVTRWRVDQAGRFLLPSSRLSSFHHPAAKARSGDRTLDVAP